MISIKSNRLLSEASPYLLQHAYNPVNWYPWGTEALETAVAENKLLILSIGYSACHWCHVMEKETFMDEEAADLMNRHFICIKIDREERPDLDQIYMQSVQMIRGQGGWPLNVFALADGRPFYGGTYFRKQQWMETLEQIARLKENRPNDLLRQAEQITEGLLQKDIFKVEKPDNAKDLLDEAVILWSQNFDLKEGGMKGAPKFPMPVQHEFLLRYYYHSQLTDIRDFVLVSLQKMAKGGIYDQLGGGFARYSTDSYWKIPHFEKMLYDNAQLIRIYTEAWQLTQEDFYKDIVFETVEFILNEISSEEGGFYSALDADSEGEEGRYYAWTADEIREFLSSDADFFNKIYGIGEDALWEDNKNILLRIAEPKNDSEKALLDSCRHLLLEARKKRVSPGLDDKILTSWNAMMCAALVFAAQVFQQDSWVESAKRNLELLLTKLRDTDGRLLHRYKNGTAGIPAFLEDYCFLIEACLAFPIAEGEKYVWLAKELTDTAIADFYDPETSLFYFISGRDNTVIARKTETADNVIPSSNAVMARNLMKLSLLFENQQYREIAESMVNVMQARIGTYLSSHCNWGIAVLEQEKPFYTLVITGENAGEQMNELQQQYLPNVIIVIAGNNSSIPLFQSLGEGGETRFYLCTSRECLPPEKSIEMVLSMISK